MSKAILIENVAAMENINEEIKTYKMYFSRLFLISAIVKICTDWVGIAHMVFFVL